MAIYTKQARLSKKALHQDDVLTKVLPLLIKAALDSFKFISPDIKRIMPKLTIVCHTTEDDVVLAFELEGPDDMGERLL